MVQARKGKAEQAVGSGLQSPLVNAPPASREERPGTGALCPEAQADGVPCFDLGRDCDVCEHARGGVDLTLGADEDRPQPESNPTMVSRKVR
jgi:hypothetical protein